MIFLIRGRYFQSKTLSQDKIEKLIALQKNKPYLDFDWKFTSALSALVTICITLIK